MFAVLIGALTLVALILPPPADARITRIEITTQESPTFGGYAWPGVGQYEKLVGKAFGEVDPVDPKNALRATGGTARSIRATSPPPTTTATTSPACGWST